MFQSAPDPKAGREDDDSLISDLIQMFQSAPDPKAGRERGRVDAVLRGHVVSIRSRPEGRERVVRWNRCRATPTGFNPLPTRRPGERPGPRSARGQPEVSIRSRPEGREREPALGGGIGASYQFQSAPDPKAGREFTGAIVRQCVRFQSAPDPKAGREARRTRLHWK